MKRNEHNIDRIIRLVLAVVFFALTAATSFWPLAILGVIMLGTAAVGFCPLYAIFGISTCPVQPAQQK